MVLASSGRYQECRTGLARNGGEKKRIGAQKSLSTAVRIKHKCWRRICGLNGGLSKL